MHLSGREIPIVLHVIIPIAIAVIVVMRAACISNVRNVKYHLIFQIRIVDRVYYAKNAVLDLLNVEHVMKSIVIAHGVVLNLILVMISRDVCDVIIIARVDSRFQIQSRIHHGLLHWVCVKLNSCRQLHLYHARLLYHKIVVCLSRFYCRGILCVDCVMFLSV